MSRPAFLASPGAVIATAAFAAIAVLRAVQGDLLWAGVFAAAAAGYAWLAATRPCKAAISPTRPGARPGAPAAGDAFRRARTWRNLTASAAVLTTGLALWSEPAIALLGAGTTVAAALGWLSARRALSTPTTSPEGARP